MVGIRQKGHVRSEMPNAAGCRLLQPRGSSAAQVMGCSAQHDEPPRALT